MKLPFSIGIQLVYRILLPGFLVALSAYPLMLHFRDAFLTGFDPAFGITLLTLLSGWMFSLLDMQIYMLLEGRRYWPDWLYQFGIRTQNNRLADLNTRFSAAQSTQSNVKNSAESIAKARRDELEISVELRNFPVDDNGEFQVELPSRLGNLLTAYEDYPKTIYGLDGMFYWSRLWLLLDNDQRSEIDGQQAVVDSAAYSTVALITGAVVLLVSAVIIHPANAIWAVVCLLLSFIVYRGSLSAHAQFGALFKAVFDVHHEKIQLNKIVWRIEEDLGDTTGIDLDTNRGKGRNVWRWLHNRRIKVGDQVVPIARVKDAQAALGGTSSSQAKKNDAS